MNELILKVALNGPIRGLFDYRPPPGLPAESLQPGQRLLLPFGRSRRCGILVALASHSPLAPGKLRSALKLLDEQPLIDIQHLEFLRWVAGYYHAPEGEVLMAALPARLRQGKPLLKPRLSHVQLTPAGRKQNPKELQRAPRQQQLLHWLQKHEGQASMERLRKHFPQPQASLSALERKGWLIRSVSALSLETTELEQPHELHPEQATAVAAVNQRLHEYSAWLLDGVTGSGKTEVYLHLAAKVLEQGRQVLLLVPEISLTPQLVRNVRRRLPGPLALLHSALSHGEREAAWLAAAQGRARVVLGTRSAVLTPIPRLGLVLVDEEQDSSFKQQEGFRYSARDMALVRAQRARCPVVLGSATPSFETLKNAQEGRYGWLRLSRRAGKASAPKLQLIDVRNQRLQGGLSNPLLERLAATLEQGRQAIVFLNRRGYAPVLTCYSCGWLSDCPHCDARQTVHRRQSKLICHHCGAESRLPQQCPACHSIELYPLGQGTEQLEQVLQQHFPKYPLIRIDRDSVSRKGELQRLLKQARDGDAHLLVGTQMLAKGHHFPGVALVALVDVDSGLFGADFRAAERMAQLIVQVAGRAGRGDHPGQVLLQTRFPEHPMLQALSGGDYAEFAQAALKERKMAQLPPFSHQALIRAAARKAEIAEGFLQSAAQLATTLDCADIGLWGPVPAPMLKRANRYRMQLLLQSPSRPALQTLLHQLVPQLDRLPEAGKVKWSVDVDPVDLY